jgi:hypothetical protein
MHMERQRLRGGCDVPNVESVIDLLERFGVFGLGGCDGCECAHFQILGIHVDVSCRKSEHCVRVHSDYMYFDHTRLIPLAREVLSQLCDPSQYSVRFCNYSSDHKNGRRENGQWKDDQMCCYCGQLRQDRDGYLCDVCIAAGNGIDTLPLRLPALTKDLVFEFAEAEELG